MRNAISKPSQLCKPSEQSRAFGRRTLLVALLVALFGSMVGEYHVLTGEITGAERLLIGSGVVMEILIGSFLMMARRRHLVAAPQLVILYFAGYLTAGVVISAYSESMQMHIVIYLLWFFPLLILNRLIHDTRVARYLEGLLRAVPVVILLLLLPREFNLFSRALFGIIPVYILSYTLFGVMLKMVTRYREAYLTELSQNETLKAERRALSQDALTGLPNRSHLMQVMTDSYGSLTPEGRCGALILISLTGLRSLNYSLGQSAGDDLLLQISCLLRTCESENSLLARWGGREFAVYLSGLEGDPGEGEHSVKGVIDRIIRTLESADVVYGTASNSPFRIGIAEFGRPKIAADQLVTRAEIALQEATAKQLAKPTYFADAMLSKLEERKSMEADLRLALHLDQFELVYQPQVCKAGRVAGAEALLRWNHPTKGLISPADFIPLAEETGLIIAIGGWVLTEACRQCSAWAKLPQLAEIVVSVNVSPRQLLDADFVTTVMTALEQTGAPPNRIKLELTESSMQMNLEASIAKMQKLRACQITFSLDDFGTGYSSLARLHLLPLDSIKIDRSFVIDIDSNPKSSSIVHTITDLARRLKLSLVAEGMETREQLEALHELGCDLYQGYFYSRPRSALAFAVFVESREADREAALCYASR